jgi:hypothetical protein
MEPQELASAIQRLVDWAKEHAPDAEPPVRSACVTTSAAIRGTCRSSPGRSPTGTGRTSRWRSMRGLPAATSRSSGSR